MTGELDPQRWTTPGGSPTPADGLDLSRVATRAEARALAEAVARSTPATPVTPSTANRPVAPAPVPSPHVPAPWGAAAPTPPRPFTPVTPPPPPVAPPPPLKASRSGLSLFGTILRVLCLISAASYAARGLGAIWASNSFAVGEAPSAAMTVDPTIAFFGPLPSIALSLTMLAQQVCLIVWLALVTTDRRTDRRRVKRGPVGVVLGFFVPVISLWWPYQALRDAWRGTDLRPAGKTTPMSIVGWWALNIVGAFVLSTFVILAVHALAFSDKAGYLSNLFLGLGVFELFTVMSLLCLSFAIGRVCFHLDAHDLLREHHDRTHPPLYRTA